MSKNRYPKIGLRSKNEIAKRLAGSKPIQLTRALIDRVIKHFDNFWYDSSDSEPDRDKFVRSAFGTPLGKLLELIDQHILAPHDNLLPQYIFGGLSKRNHVQAAHYLLEKQKNRMLLGLDVKGFFEQISRDRVFYLFHSKCECSVDAANILADLCCVPRESKGSGSTEKILARGFATSTRLSIWCNLDLFIRLKWQVDKQLYGHDPRIAIFIDDIGVSASRVSREQMEAISIVIENLLNDFDKNQKLPINRNKKKICDFTKAEHLGMKLGRTKVSMGHKARSRMDHISEQLRKVIPGPNRDKLLASRKAYFRYQSQIAKVNSK
jgi:hypothetical protein